MNIIFLLTRMIQIDTYGKIQMSINLYERMLE